MRAMRPIGPVVVPLLFLLLGTATQAQTTIWNAGTASWHDPGNWTAGVPTPTVDAIVNNGGTPVITLAADASVVSVQSGNLRIDGGDLTCNAVYVTGNGLVEQIAGSVAVAGDLRILPGSYSGLGGTCNVFADFEVDGPAVLDGTGVAAGVHFTAGDLDLLSGGSATAGADFTVPGSLVSVDGSISFGGNGFASGCDLTNSTLSAVLGLGCDAFQATGSTITASSLIVGTTCSLDGSDVLVSGTDFQADDVFATNGSTVDVVGDFRALDTLTASSSSITADGEATLGTCVLDGCTLGIGYRVEATQLSALASGITAGWADVTGACDLDATSLTLSIGDLDVGTGLTVVGGALAVATDVTAGGDVSADGVHPFEVYGNLAAGGALTLSNLPDGSIQGSCSAVASSQLQSAVVEVGGTAAVGGNATAIGGSLLVTGNASVSGTCSLQSSASWNVLGDTQASDLQLSSSSLATTGLTAVDATWIGSNVSTATYCDLQGAVQWVDADVAVGGTLALTGATTQAQGTVSAVQGIFAGSYETWGGTLLVFDLDLDGSFTIHGGTSSLTADQLTLGPSASLEPRVDPTGLSPFVTDLCVLGGSLIVTDDSAPTGVHDLVTATTSVTGSFASVVLPGPMWWTHSSATAFSLEKGMPDNVAAVGDGDCLGGDNLCETVPVVFSKADPTEARGISVTFEISPELALCVDPASSIRQGTWLDGFASTFQVIDHGGGIYTADQAILGDPCGTATSGTLFEVDVTPTIAEGLGTITVTEVEVRDCVNGALPGSPGAPASFEIDTVPPAAVTDLATSQKKTGNDSDGTTEITVSFTTPPDADEVLVYRKGFGDYPEYDDGTGEVPAIPATPADALLDGWAVTPVTAGGQTDDPGTRDFWYHVVFTADACGNVSAPSNFGPGTLSYHLGDVSDGMTPGQGDNTVGIADVSDLGANYGVPLTYGAPHNYLDVGPTGTGSVDGLPLTDDVIGFEDLMIFAINFGEVSRGTTPEVRGTPSLVLRPTADGDRLTAALHLLGHESGVKGIRAHVGFDRSALELLVVEPGELLQSAGATFLESLDDARGAFVDLAVLGHGTALEGSGELATLTFRLIDPEATPRLLGVDARGANNERLGDRFALLEGRPADPDGAPALPTRLELVGARPNPFARTTDIVFRLPEPGRVSVTIHDVAGRRVRTLVNGVLPAGEHRAVWDGRTDGGRVSGAGVYFYTFRAEDHRETRKILRVR